MNHCLLPRFLVGGLTLFTAAAGQAGESYTMRIMTYNIHTGIGPASRLNLRATAAAIRDTNAEVVALQEVDRRWGLRSVFRDQAARLARDLGMHFVFGATRDRRPRAPGRGEYGLAILSRHAIARTDFHLLPGELEQRGVLLAWVDAPGGEIPVACTHLGLSDADRQGQVAAILDWLPERPDLIIMGDMNAEPGAPELSALHERLIDLQAACGYGDKGTFLYRGRNVRIDYIFAGARWKPLGCTVEPVDASDHRPVVADVALDTVEQVSP